MKKALTSETKQFTIRVYGLLINKLNQVLLSQEFHGGRFYIKFPGGGLEFGESTIDCLKREFREELATEITVLNLIHLSDSFFLSAFHPNTQVIAAYYSVSIDNPEKICVASQLETDFSGPAGPVCFFWQKIECLDETLLSLPSDKQLVSILKSMVS